VNTIKNHDLSSENKSQHKAGKSTIKIQHHIEWWTAQLGHIHQPLHFILQIGEAAPQHQDRVELLQSVDLGDLVQEASGQIMQYK
jgi:hypothetical protein